MKKITLFLSAMLFSVMSFAGLGEGYSKVTDITTLSAGDKVVLYSDDAELGITGWDGTKTATAATDGWVEYVVEVADGGFLLKDGEQYIALTVKNSFSYNATGSVCKVTADGILYITLEGTDYLLYENANNGSPLYRMYADKTGNSQYKPFYVYEVGEGGGETPDTPVDPEEPETPVDPENPGTPEEPETPVGSIDGYSKVTNAASLVAGDKVVLYCDDAQLGVTGWNGNKDATVAESGWVEYVVEVADGGFYLKDGEQYISLTTKNTFTYKTTGSVCKVTSEGILYITLEGVDYLLYENGGQYYRMYTDKSSNSAYKPFYVYKAGEGGGETPEPEDPDQPENPDPEQPENPEPENPEEPEMPAGEVTFDADVDKGNASEDAANQTEYTVEKDGVTMVVSKGIIGVYNNENHYRIYKNQTLTITSTAGNIVSVEFTCTANDDAQYGPGCFTVDGGSYTYSGAVGTWTGSVSKIVFTASTNQVRATEIVVTLGEGGGETPDPEDPEQPEEPGDVEIKGLVYADAYYYEYDGVAYYDIDMYKDIDMDTYEYTYPEVYVSLEAKSKTALNGTYDVWYAGYWKSANDSVEINETTPGTITIKNTDNEGNYSVSGSFVGTDGKTYSFNDVVSVWAFDFDNYEEITLSEDGSDTPETPDTPEGMITCAEAASIAAAENYKGTENVIVYGYVVELVNQKVDEKTGRNKQTFYMSDTKGGEQQFMAYWAFVPDFFEVGDKVAITGILQNYKGTIEIADGEAVLLNETGVDDVLVENTPVKVIKNAQMYIMQGNKVYTIMGTQVK